MRPAPVNEKPGYSVEPHDSEGDWPSLTDTPFAWEERAVTKARSMTSPRGVPGSGEMASVLLSASTQKKDATVEAAPEASALHESPLSGAERDGSTGAETAMPRNSHENRGEAIVDDVQGGSGPTPTSPVSNSESTQKLEEVLNPPSKGYSTWAKVLFRYGDLPYHIVGGILAGSNAQVQNQYQKHPFKPFNWVFGYDDPPTEQEAAQWTTAQLAFNDALEAGLVAKDSPSLRPDQKITIKIPSFKGNGSPGLIWVLEPTPNPKTPAGRYQAEIPSVADAEGKKIWVPALGFANSNGRGYKFVKFDGIDFHKKTVVDRKFNVTGFAKQADDIDRQVEAMMQNPEWTLVIEVPSERVGKAVLKLYDKAIKKAMPADGPVRPMPKISINLVLPGSTNPQKFDAGPVSEVEAPRSSIK